MANQIATNGRHSTDMLTISDVARLLHVHQNSVRRWANAGLLGATELESEAIAGSKLMK